MNNTVSLGHVLTSDGFRGTLKGFADVDHHPHPQSLLEYLDLSNSNPFTKACKQTVLNLLNPQYGDHVLEIGCGAGHMAFELAARVGSAGLVTGIDASSIMIQEARRRYLDSDGVRMNFLVQDAHQLHFVDNVFDGGFIISTLIHVKNPRKVLSELFRVVKPGKRIAVQEGDWDTLVISTGNPEVDPIVQRVLRNSIQNSGVGHQLPTLMKAAGFSSIAVGSGTIMAMDFHSADETWRIRDSITEAREANSITTMEAATILDTLMIAAQRDEFFATATGFVVTGDKTS